MFTKQTSFCYSITLLPWLPLIMAAGVVLLRHEHINDATHTLPNTFLFLCPQINNHFPALMLSILAIKTLLACSGEEKTNHEPTTQLVPIGRYTNLAWSMSKTVSLWQSCLKPDHGLQGACSLGRRTRATVSLHWEYMGPGQLVFEEFPMRLTSNLRFSQPKKCIKVRWGWYLDFLAPEPGCFDASALVEKSELPVPKVS